MNTCIPVFSPVCTAIGLGVVSLFALWVLWQVFRGLVYGAIGFSFADRDAVNSLAKKVADLQDASHRDATRCSDCVVELTRRIYDLETKSKKKKKK